MGVMEFIVKWYEIETVMEIQKDQVSLAIDAPEEVKVYCEEIYESLPDYASPPYG